MFGLTHSFDTLARSEKRLRFLDELARESRGLSKPTEVMKLTARMLGEHLEVNRCVYARVDDDQKHFHILGDHCRGVSSIAGRHAFMQFDEALQHLMHENRAYVNVDVDADPRTAGTDLSVYRLHHIQSLVCLPLHKDGRLVAVMAVHQSIPRRWMDDEVELVGVVADRCWEALDRLRMEDALRIADLRLNLALAAVRPADSRDAQGHPHSETDMLELLNRTGAALAAELDLQALLQLATDAGTQLTGARFGAFFYNATDERGDTHQLYTLSGAPKEAFSKFGHPRPTDVLAPTFNGGPPLRSDDITKDPRYGRWAPHHGMPAGHMPLRSYLGVSVMGRNGAVIGGLFFGHPDAGVFTERSERLAVGIAAQAAIAVDNARLYAESQRAVEERKMLLESERAARRELERASAVKDEFLATLSHELRTPLSSIMGWVHVLRRRLPPNEDEMHKGVDVIERNARVQVQLIDDLLDMSRITSGKLRLNVQPVAPVTFIQSALETVAHAAEAAGVSLQTRLDPAVGPIMGDPARLQQVVWNLLSNAIKFTPRGGRVTLTLSQRASHLEIAIEDTGIGISREVLPFVFDRFRQGDGSLTRRHSGLGLGLSIVKHLIEAQGGEVEGRSEGEGRGACFIVRLPTQVLAVSQSRAAAPAAPGIPADNDLAGVKVMVVDDETDSRELVRRILEESGAQVVMAADAAEALAKLPNEHPDVLVSDIGMPDVDGYELLRRVRKLGSEAGGTVPAIALTAFARSDDRVRALRAGFSVHVAKPMEPMELLATVASVAGRTGPGTTVPAELDD